MTVIKNMKTQARNESLEEFFSGAATKSFFHTLPKKRRTHVHTHNPVLEIILIPKDGLLRL